MSRDARHYTAEDMREQGLRYAQFLTAIIETERKNAMSEQPDTVDFVREWLMSSDHPISDWEREFAAAIDARNASPAADIETEPLAEEATAKPRMFFGQSNRFVETPKAAPMREDAIAAVFKDLRGRRLIKYLFDDNPDNCAAYGYVDAPIDLETQQEIVEKLVEIVFAHTARPAAGEVGRDDIGIVLAWAITGASSYGTGLLRPIIEKLCRDALARPDAGDDQREHVMPGDPADIMQIALQWYLNFNFAFPHSVRESNIAVEGFKDGYRAALSRPDAGGEDVERAYRLGYLRAVHPQGWDVEQDGTHGDPVFDANMREDLESDYPTAMREGVDRGMVDQKVIDRLTRFSKSPENWRFIYDLAVSPDPAGHIARDIAVLLTVMREGVDRGMVEQAAKKVLSLYDAGGTTRQFVTAFSDLRAALEPPL